jgi:phosphodiesterase/alkaline phosphatase D-like protein
MRNKETLEEFIKEYQKNKTYWNLNNKDDEANKIKMGAKWQQEQNKKFYSEEDMKQAFENGVASGKYQQEYGVKGSMDFEYFIKQFKNKIR